MTLTRKCKHAFAFTLMSAASGALAGSMAFVDPFVGTTFTGHTHPAACVPFGLVQAGPDTGNLGWHYCSGYRHEDKVIVGFSQTHLNGTGGMDLGDAMIMPVRDARQEGFPWSRFRKESEKAAPGWYRVRLDDARADVEVTATAHVGCYAIRYEGAGPKRLLVDSQYGIGHNADWLARHVISSDVRPHGEDAIGGTLKVRQWVLRSYSFKAVFSRPFAAVEELPRREAGERAPRYLLTFDLKDGEPLLVKVALSACGGLEGAAANLVREVPGWDFNAVRSAAEAKWEDILSRAAVEGTDDAKRNFYTALYHLCQQPNDLADAGAKPSYSTFSCWDTFRAAHPLYTILTPEYVPGFVDSMLEQGKRTGYLPIWTLWGKENQCMIGTHSVPVIVDWFLKEQVKHEGEQGNSNLDYWESAYQQIKETLTKRHEGRRKENWDLLDRYGYYPCDVIRGESVSRTLECAYDDWCAALMAEKLGKSEDAAFFRRRAASWKNVFDPSIGLVRGKRSDGSWRTPYDPLELGHGAENDNDFTEGNAWQYTWHVMQDPEGLIAAMGGPGKTLAQLDRLFTQKTVLLGGGKRHDITGMIGQYVHGNEPSHHIPYFYQYLGRPDRVAEIVREVFDRFYMPKPDGLCGNDDCGQMSAWYVFAAMGFYPFNPCGGEYVLGAPQVEKVTLRCSPSPSTFTSFTVVARGLSKENKYVKSVTLNGRPITDWKIRHADILRGGELVFEMTNDAKEIGGGK